MFQLCMGECLQGNFGEAFFIFYFFNLRKKFLLELTTASLK